jgi:formate dehydrogenase subunit gamma
MEQGIERYRKPTRILHWVHTGAFIALFLTGLILFIPPLSVLAEDSWTRFIHRIASVIFVFAPLIYLSLNWKSSIKGIKDAFSWGLADLGWIKAAPRYYFFCDEEAMPPQEHMNTGQKMWWFLVIVFSITFVITGLLMWLFKGIAGPTLLQWMVLIHDVAFIVTGLMFFVHIYMSVVHPLVRPLRTGSLASMTRGKVSIEYAKSHHAKWYDEISKPETPQENDD